VHAPETIVVFTAAVHPCHVEDGAIFLEVALERVVTNSGLGTVDWTPG